MNTNENIKQTEYFNNRQVDAKYYSQYVLPKYLRASLPSNKNIKVLDIGCGFGQFLFALKQMDYTNLTGIDINDESINECKSKGINAIQINDIREFARNSTEKYDIIIMSHVLEHIDKDIIIDTLAHIKKYLLSDGGKFLLMVPNAQSYTGAYWRYEDFTHTTMFTAGSCIYTLKSAGFSEINFIDADGTTYMNFIKKIIIKSLLFFHKKREDFWNLVLQTSYHKPSPRIYSFELKVEAK